MPIDPVTALQASVSPARIRTAGGPRRLLLAGAVGRTGEALLNEALGRGAWDEVVVLAEAGATMSLGVRGLALAPLDALPPIVDACLLPTTDPQSPGARSFHGRDAPFAAVDPLALPRVAAAIAAAGGRRVALVHPLPVWQQLSRLHLGLAGEAELAIARLPFESVTVLRPVAPSGSPGAAWLQRVAGVYLSLQFLMAPRSLPTLTSAQIARLVVDALRDARPGVSVVGAAELAERLVPVASGDGAVRPRP